MIFPSWSELASQGVGREFFLNSLTFHLFLNQAKGNSSGALFKILYFVYRMHFIMLYSVNLLQTRFPNKITPVVIQVIAFYLNTSMSFIKIFY